MRLHQIRAEDSAAAIVADGTYAVEVVDGVIVGLAEITVSNPEPLTTIIAGVPSLVWDTDGQIVYTEV